MSDKVKAESFRERLHLRHRNHLAPGAAQHHDMRVVDHDLLGNASDITQRVRKEHFAIEALERGINLEEQQARVTQHRRSGLRLVLLTAQLHIVRGRVVLQFHPGIEGISAGRHNRSLSNALPAAEGRQCLIRQCRTAGR